VTFARSLTDTFAGIVSTNVPAFMLAQLIGMGPRAPCCTLHSAFADRTSRLEQVGACYASHIPSLRTVLWAEAG
jgi:hypothetical protein